MSYFCRSVLSAVVVPALATFGVCHSADAAQIRGRVQAPAVDVISKTLGYAKTRVTSSAISRRTAKQDLAIYLKVKNSLPLKKPTQKHQVKLHGQMFRPSVSSCVFDEAIVITNMDRATVHVVVGDQPLGAIAPGEKATWKCEVAGFHPIRVREWGHARAHAMVGGTGVALRPDAAGNFTLQAPAGEYELQVISSAGVIEKSDLTVGDTDLELGLVGAEQAAIGDTVASDDDEVDEPPPPPPAAVVAAPTPAAAAVPARPAAAPSTPAVAPPAARPIPARPIPARPTPPKPAGADEDDFFEMDE